MVQAKKFIYAKRFEGMPKISDFTLEEETLPELSDGGLFIKVLQHFWNKWHKWLNWKNVHLNIVTFFISAIEIKWMNFSSNFIDVLLEAICLSVDPYMRPYSERLPLGVTMIGAQIAKYRKKYISSEKFLFSIFKREYFGSIFFQF